MLWHLISKHLRQTRDKEYLFFLLGVILTFMECVPVCWSFSPSNPKLESGLNFECEKDVIGCYSMTGIRIVDRETIGIKIDR